METNQVNPGVSVDQMGAESRKRAAEESADSEKHSHANKPCGPLTLESSAQENEVDSTAFDEEFASPNSHWEASNELSTFLGTTNKRMNKFEHRALVRSYPRHALLLTGDASASINVNRRELVLKKMNPFLASMAQEHFPDAKRQLFGPGFEQRLKSSSETAGTV